MTKYFPALALLLAIVSGFVFRSTEKKNFITALCKEKPAMITFRFIVNPNIWNDTCLTSVTGCLACDHELLSNWNDTSGNALNDPMNELQSTIHELLNNPKPLPKHTK